MGDIDALSRGKILKELPESLRLEFTRKDRIDALFKAIDPSAPPKMADDHHNSFMRIHQLVQIASICP